MPLQSRTERTLGLVAEKGAIDAEGLLRKRRAGTLSLGEHAPELLTLCGEILTPMNTATTEAGVAEIKRQKSKGADFIKRIFVSPKTFFATFE